MALLGEAEGLDLGCEVSDDLGPLVVSLLQRKDCKYGPWVRWNEHQLRIQTYRVPIQHQMLSESAQIVEVQRVVVEESAGELPQHFRIERKIRSLDTPFSSSYFIEVV